VRTDLTAKNAFRMPALIDAETAAARILRELDGTAFEITVPRRFAYALKLLRMLPYRLYFPVIRWVTGS
jgi:hypothetical protein